METDSQASLIQSYIISEAEKVDPHIGVTGLGLVYFGLNIILRQYLDLSSITTFWDFTALYDQKPTPIGTFKMVQMQHLALICWSVGS